MNWSEIIEGLQAHVKGRVQGRAVTPHSLVTFNTTDLQYSSVQILHPLCKIRAKIYKDPHISNINEKVKRTALVKGNVLQSHTVH